MSNLSELPKRLVPWHRQNKRDLPWRIDSSPYHTWLSEIMLQQTRIEAVIPYYYRFLNELPTVAELAAVDDDRLMKLWEGLGYYSRARNLKKAAVMVMEQYDGQLPSQFSLLRALPGIGDYTAGAIASMAFGQPEPAVDGNVLRVVTRFIGDNSDITLAATKKNITNLLRSVYPVGDDAGDFTEGLMELGETVCIPAGNPRCDVCPIRDLCVAFKENRTRELPVKTEKKKRKAQDITVFVLQHGDTFALRKRKKSGLLADMWELPNADIQLDDVGVASWLSQHQLSDGAFQQIGSATHIFTHIEWNMQGIHVVCPQQSAEFVWVTAEQLRNEFALPTAFRYFKDYILAKGE